MSTAKLPENKSVEMSLQNFTEQEQNRIKELASQIPIGDSNAVMLYGTSAQGAITGFSESMLSKVRGKDTGEIGETLNSLMSSLHEVKVGDFQEKGVFNKLIRKVRRSSRNVMTRYQTVSTQVDRITYQLEQSKVGLMEDIGVMDKMYEENKEYLKGIELYIVAGEMKLNEIHNEILPTLQAKALESHNTLAQQELQDMNQFVDRLDKRMHDLKLTKQIIVQSAPQIRMIQATSQTLAEKIQSSITTSIPLWKNQITIALTLKDQAAAVKTQKMVSDTTNNLMLKNSEMLKINTIETAKENERSIVDVDTLKKTQENLVETIEETMKIQAEGRKQRKAAEIEIEKMEQELKNRIIAIHDKGRNDNKTDYSTPDTINQKVNFLEM